MTAQLRFSAFGRVSSRTRSIIIFSSQGFVASGDSLKVVYDSDGAGTIRAHNGLEQRSESDVKLLSTDIQLKP
jgi:hypothetical protein